MENNVNFRVGDKVFNICRGNGVIKEIYEGETWPIIVEFNNSYIESYKMDGKLYRTDINRSLYHGHDLKFTIEEKLPVRKRKGYVNLYQDISGNIYVGGGVPYNSIEEAYIYRWEGYLKTVEVEIDA